MREMESDQIPHRQNSTTDSLAEARTCASNLESGNVRNVSNASERSEGKEAGGEAFLARWSRRKREIRAGAVPPDEAKRAAAPAPLPSFEALAAQGLDADYSAFMQAGVAAEVRRTAIKQLFGQPVFNVMDGLDVYIEDFNIYEPLTHAELPNLAHARDLLFAQSEPGPEAVSESARETSLEGGPENLSEPLSDSAANANANAAARGEDFAREQRQPLESASIASHDPSASDKEARA